MGVDGVKEIMELQVRIYGNPVPCGKTAFLRKEVSASRPSLLGQ